MATTSMPYLMLAVGVLPLAGCPSAGSTTCSEFYDMNGDEQQDVLRDLLNEHDLVVYDPVSLGVSWVGWVGLWGFRLVGMGLIVACGCDGVARVVAVGGLCLPVGFFLGLVGGWWLCAGAMGRRGRVGC